jgi:hypothetical protein
MEEEQQTAASDRAARRRQKILDASAERMRIVLGTQVWWGQDPWADGGCERQTTHVAMQSSLEPSMDTAGAGEGSAAVDEDASTQDVAKPVRNRRLQARTIKIISAGESRIH